MHVSDVMIMGCSFINHSTAPYNYFCPNLTQVSDCPPKYVLKQALYPGFDLMFYMLYVLYPSPFCGFLFVLFFRR